MVWETILVAPGRPPPDWSKFGLLVKCPGPSENRRSQRSAPRIRRKVADRRRVCPQRILSGPSLGWSRAPAIDPARAPIATGSAPFGKVPAGSILATIPAKAIGIMMPREDPTATRVESHGRSVDNRGLPEIVLPASFLPGFRSSRTGSWPRTRSETFLPPGKSSGSR